MTTPPDPEWQRQQPGQQPAQAGYPPPPGYGPPPGYQQGPPGYYDQGPPSAYQQQGYQQPGYPPQDHQGAPPGYPQQGYQQSGGMPSAQLLWPGIDALKIAAPSGVPKDIQTSFLMWTALAGLVVVMFVISLIGSASSGSGIGLGSYVFWLLLSLGAAYGAVMMRAGMAWGRILAAVCGGILGLFLLIGLIVLLGALGLIGGALGGSLVLVIIIPLLIVIAGLGLIIAGMVFMLRPAASAYLTPLQAR